MMRNWTRFQPVILMAVIFGGSRSAIGQKWWHISNELYDQIGKIARSIEGDIQQDKQIRKAALESSRKMWRYISANANEPNIDQAWFRLFHMDMLAADQKVYSEHLQICLEKFPKDSDIFRSARRLLARQAIFKTRGLTELRAEIQRFDKDFPEAVFDRVDLRMLAAEYVLEAGDMNIAETLYDEAHALARDKLSSWQAVWKSNQDRLELFQKSLDDFGGVDLGGKPIQIRDFRGKVVLISFWCSCGDCKSGHLADCRLLSKELRAKGLEIVGISFEPTADDAKKAAEELKLNWRHLWNDKDSANSPKNVFKVKEVPFSVLIDALGRVRGIGLSGLELEEKIKKLLAEAPRIWKR